MIDSFFLRLVLSLWRMSTLFSVVVIAWVYCQVLGLSFVDIDEGKNQHKVAIVLFYLLYLLLWWWLNPKFERLEKLSKFGRKKAQR